MTVDSSGCSLYIHPPLALTTDWSRERKICLDNTTRSDFLRYTARYRRGGDRAFANEMAVRRLFKWLAQSFEARYRSLEFMEGPFLFQDLPAELRITILRYAMIRREPIQPELTRFKQRNGYEYRQAQLYSTALTQVNQRVGQAASDILYGENTFTFCLSAVLGRPLEDKLSNWLQRIGLNKARKVKEITLRCFFNLGSSNWARDPMDVLSRLERGWRQLGLAQLQSVIVTELRSQTCRCLGIKLEKGAFKQYVPLSIHISIVSDTTRHDTLSFAWSECGGVNEVHDEGDAEGDEGKIGLSRKIFDSCVAPLP